MSAIVMAVISANPAQAQNCGSNMLSLNADSYLAIPSSSGLQVQGGFTTEFWVRFTSVQENVSFIEKASPNGRAIFSVGLGSDQVVIARVATDSGDYSITSTVQIPLASWTHIALVYRQNDSLLLYINGVLSASRGLKATGKPLGNNDSLFIGRTVAAATRTFAGSIDEIRLWNIARTAGEIALARSTILDPVPDQLLLYLPFDDAPSAMPLHDFSTLKNPVRSRGEAVNILTSTSPVTGSIRGFKISSVEKSVEFGNFLCSAIKDTLVRIRNLGSDSVFINSIGFLRGTAFSVAAPQNLRLPPDSSVTPGVRIHFQPSIAGDFYDTLILSSTSICGGVHRIGVHAFFDSVGLRFDRTTANFGQVAECTLPFRLETNIINTGSKEITITSLDPQGDPGLVVIAQPLPVKLNPGDAIPIAIQLGAGPIGLVNASITASISECSRNAKIAVLGERTTPRLTLPANLALGSIPMKIGGAVRDTVVVLHNVGSTKVIVTNLVSSDAAHFLILSPRINTLLNIGDTVHIRIRFRSEECGLFSAQITAGGIPCNFVQSTMLSAEVTPPLATVVKLISFGLQCGSAERTVFLKNSGGDTIRFSGAFTNSGALKASPATVTDIKPGDSIPITLTLLDAAENLRDSVFLRFLPCGAIPISVTSLAARKAIAVNTKQLYFGRSCSSRHTTETLTLKNTTSIPITITDTLLFSMAGFEISGLSLPLTLEPGASKSISVLYSPKTAGVHSGTLSFFGGDCEFLTVRVKGSTGDQQYALSQRVLSFDTICPGFAATRHIYVRNSSGDSLNISGNIVAPSLFVTSFRDTLIPVGGVADVPVTFAPPATGDFKSSLSLTIGACSVRELIELSGSGGSAPQLLFTNPDFDFGGVDVGDSAEVCLDVQNPSCLAAIFDANTLNFGGLPFSLSASTLQRLPIRVESARSEQICIIFKPKDRSAIDTTFLTGNNPSGALTLRGFGKSAEIVAEPALLDFGYVLRNDKRIIPVILRNIGNKAATASLSLTSQIAFSLSVPSVIIPSGEARPVDVAFEPTGVGRRDESLRVLTANQNLLIPLRGEGTDKGIQLSALEFDFNKLHVGDTESNRLFITATNGFPVTISALKLEGATPGAFDFAASSTPPFVINSVADTLFVPIIYRPTVQGLHTAQLTITNDSRPVALPLRGEAVEADPRIPSSLALGTTEVGKTSNHSLLLSNTGGYPFSVDSVEISGSEYSVTTKLPLTVSASGFARIFLQFTPSTARRYKGSLLLHTSAPQRDYSVRLDGSGGYTALSRPSVTVGVDDAALSAGDKIILSARLSGKNLDRLLLDTLSGIIRYDPSMVYISSINSVGTITGNMRIYSEEIAPGQLRVCFGSGKLKAAAGPLLNINIEALYGPTEFSSITFDALDVGAATALTASGTIHVTDCGEKIAPIAFGNPSSIGAGQPNPAQSTIVYRLTLGLKGDLRADVFNDQGICALSLTFPELAAGRHNIDIPLSALPEGSYLITFRSGDFTETRKFIRRR